MQGRPACVRILERHGVFKCFRAVRTREDSLDRADQLRDACDAVGLLYSEVLFVGDKQSDLEAGRKLSATVALVGKRAKEDWGPDFLFRELQGLRDLVLSPS